MGSFLIRLLSQAKPKYASLNLIPTSLLKGLEAEAPNFWKWANAVIKEKSVNYIFDEEAVAKRTSERIAKLNTPK